MKPGSYVADFDSATAMVRALAAYLGGKDFPLLGMMPETRMPLLRAAGALVNAAPVRLREQIYIWSGRLEAIGAGKLRNADLDPVYEYLLSLYPRKRYAAAAIGSSNGAAVHLWAALGIPWLPQTLLIPVARSGVSLDEPQEDVRWAREPARLLLESNPDIQLHHMNDPVQDRLMIQRMTYFRVKRLRLGRSYESFLERSLVPGATIFIIECNLKWPTTQYSDRHFFQFGALGGATAEEYQTGGPRVEEYLRRHRSPHRRWHPPPSNTVTPEAEWGFEPALREDVEAFARRHGFRVRRVVFTEPEHMSPLVADLYRWWNRRRAIRSLRLVVESFIIMEPYWVLRTGSIPFWMVFNKAPSAKALKRFLSARDAFDEIYTMLFSHGVDSIGLVPIEKWRRIMESHARAGHFLGVDERAYPRDFAVFVRYHEAFVKTIQERVPMPALLTTEELEDFLRSGECNYDVQWH